MKKRLLALLLAVSMVVPCIPVSAGTYTGFKKTTNFCMGYVDWEADISWDLRTANAIKTCTSVKCVSEDTKGKSYSISTEDITKNTQKASAKAGIKNSDSDKSKVTKILKFLDKRVSYKNTTSMKGVMNNLAKNKNVKGNSYVYSQAFYMLCAYNEIPVLIKFGNTGTKKKPTYEAFNIVLVDGVWYWVDAYRYDKTNGKYNMTKTLWSDHRRRSGKQKTEYYAIIGSNGKMYRFSLDTLYYNSKTLTTSILWSWNDTIFNCMMYGKPKYVLNSVTGVVTNVAEKTTELQSYYIRKRIPTLVQEVRASEKERIENERKEFERAKERAREKAEPLEKEIAEKSEVYYSLLQTLKDNSYAMDESKIETIDWASMYTKFNKAVELKSEINSLASKVYEIMRVYGQGYSGVSSPYSVINATDESGLFLKCINAFKGSNEEVIETVKGDLKKEKIYDETLSYIYNKQIGTGKEMLRKAMGEKFAEEDLNKYFDEVYSWCEFEAIIQFMTYKTTHLRGVELNNFYQTLTKELVENGYNMDAIHEYVNYGSEPYRVGDATYSDYFND